MRRINLNHQRKKLLQHQNIVLTELRRKQTRVSLDRFSHALRMLDIERPSSA